MATRLQAVHRGRSSRREIESIIAQRKPSVATPPDWPERTVNAEAEERNSIRRTSSSPAMSPHDEPLMSRTTAATTINAHVRGHLNRRTSPHRSHSAQDF
eukprot:5710388-Prymnesium_polylepis.1